MDPAEPSSSAAPPRPVIVVRMRPYNSTLTVLLCLLTAAVLWVTLRGGRHGRQAEHATLHFLSLRSAVLFLANYELEPVPGRYLSGVFRAESVCEIQQAMGRMAMDGGYLLPEAHDALVLLSERYPDAGGSGWWREHARADGPVPSGERPGFARITQALGLTVNNPRPWAGESYWPVVYSFCGELLLVIVLLPCGCAVVRLLRGKGPAAALPHPVTAAWRPGVLFGGWLRAEWLTGFSGIGLAAAACLPWFLAGERLPFSVPDWMISGADTAAEWYFRIFSDGNAHVLTSLLIVLPVLIMTAWFAGGPRMLWRLLVKPAGGPGWRASLKLALGAIWLIVIVELLVWPWISRMGWVDPRDGWTFAGDSTLESLWFSCVLAPVIEEIVFRGFLFTAFANRWKPLTAALLSTALFAAVHPYCLSGMIMVAGYGLLFAGLYHRTRSLLPGMLAHSLINLLLHLLGQ